MRVLGILALLATPVAAQDLTFSPGATEACLSGTQDLNGQQACIGASAEACMNDTPGGHSTYGMGGCLSAEADYWDAQLNAAYGAVIAEARATDAEMADIGGPAVASQEDALRAMQRAWIAYRDATCDYEYSQWGGGTGGGPAIAACIMRETGEQALYLWSSRLGG
ncbi:MAG: lysozyme inhibitor LprI family protein [Pseudomonadota bacterium]